MTVPSDLSPANLLTLSPSLSVRRFGKDVVRAALGRPTLDGTIDLRSTLYKDLKAKHFLYDDGSSPLLDILAAKIRTKYEHLNGGTKLHIFVVTLRCEHSCHYCQVSRQTATKGEFDMSRETADR